jgi:hypothetical protein
MKPEVDDPWPLNHADAAGAVAPDPEALLDHHIEELLGALSDPELLRRCGVGH